MRFLTARARSGGSRSSGWRRASLFLLVLTWAASAGYVAGRLDQGWFPPDDGILAHSAERILYGETPHKDFDDIYTGALSYLHALGFRVFGTNLLSLRLVLFVFFLLWVPVVYWIATQFAPPAIAAVTSLLAVAWSVPTYSAAMPSWYNLFLATFGTGALLKYLATGRGIWLLGAGFCAGLSVMVKIVGVYFVVGALFFLPFREQFSISRADMAPVVPARLRYSVLILGALLALLMALLLTLRYFPTLNTFTHFVLPTLALGALLLRNEGAAPAAPLRHRLAGLLRLAGPFLVGVLTPLLLFTLPYLWDGSLAELYRGAVVLPAKRLAQLPAQAGIPVRWPLPRFLTNGYVLPLIALLVLAPRLSSRGRRVALTCLMLLCAVVLVSAAARPLYHGVWYSMRPLVPVTVCTGTVLLWLRSGGGAPRLGVQEQKVLILLCVAALISLVQFPVGASPYFFYAAPLGLLAALGVTSLIHPVQQRIFALAVTFYLVFAVVWIHRGEGLEAEFVPRPRLERLSLARGGLRVRAAEANSYEQLVGAVRTLASGTHVYATPDAPEVYFLSGLRNPTRTIMELFDEPRDRTQRGLAALDRHAVNVVVIRRGPSFSGPPPAELWAALVQRYPWARQVGPFVILCRQCSP